MREGRLTSFTSAGVHLQLTVDVALVHQRVQDIQHTVNIPDLGIVPQEFNLFFWFLGSLTAILTEWLELQNTERERKYSTWDSAKQVDFIWNVKRAFHFYMNTSVTQKDSWGPRVSLTSRGSLLPDKWTHRWCPRATGSEAPEVPVHQHLRTIIHIKCADVKQVHI